MSTKRSQTKPSEQQLRRRRRRPEPPAPTVCPLCGATTQAYHVERRRPYMLCDTCWLVSVPPDHHLAPAAEKAVYDRHDNRPDHAGYRQFLRRPAAAVCARVPRPALGLDFGAGPGPTLGLMLVEAGYDMALYDPFYLPDTSVFDERYDFISATEVFEHLAAPAAEIERLLACLQPGGWLIVMTKRHSADRDAFTRWHYTHDPTHVSFFALATFEWIAEHYGLHLEVAAADVVALQRPAG